MWRARIGPLPGWAKEFCDEEAFAVVSGMLCDLKAELLNPQIAQIIFCRSPVFFVQVKRWPAEPVRHATPPPANGAQPAVDPAT